MEGKENVRQQVALFTFLTGLRGIARQGIAPLFLNGKLTGHLIPSKNAVMSVSIMK